IPGSRNLPYGELFDPETGTIRSAAALAASFERAGIDRGGPIVTTCGSGISATALAFGLYLLGNRDVAVYDGSWTEWGGRADTPVATEAS
ncbi:MAG: sulfurtransferase, partial [Alphaproteobacteria bacterium]|nr:sulfurtransferase [Alphaproteobacteria bacterium]